MTDARLERARSLIAVRRWPEATRALGEALAENPDSAEAWCLLAQCHAGAERLSEALRACERAVACDPDNEWALRLLAWQLRVHGRVDEAIETARRAVALAPDNWRVHTTYAESLARKPTAANLAAARAAADRALELAPDEAGVHLTDGNVASFARDYRRSRRAWRRALALDPESNVARHNVALDDLYRGRSFAAMEGFGSAAALAPDDGDHPQYFGLAVDAVLWRLARRCVLVAVAFAAVLLPETAARDWQRTIASTALLAMAVVALLMMWRLPPAGRRVLIGRRDHEDVEVALIVIAIQPVFVAAAGYAPWLLAPSSLRLQLLVVLFLFTVAVTWFAAVVSALTEQRRPWVVWLERLRGRHRDGR